MKKLMLNLSLALSGMVSIVPNLTAAESIKWVATGGLSYGGDDWQVAQSSSGSSVNVHGGGRIAVGLGGAWQPERYPLMVSLVANYHFDPRAGANTSAKFSRVPLDAMVYYTGLEKLRIGVGASYILTPTIKAEIDNRDETIKFKNAVGTSLELGYEVSPQLWLNLRLSSEKFKPKNAGQARETDVSHVAVNVSYLF